MKKTLTNEMLDKLNKYFRVVNYLSVAQLYLLDNPLLREPLQLKDVKKRVVGHWGTAPGQNFVYMHLNRVINKYDLNMIYISGPGHGGQAALSNVYLEGTYSEVYKDITEDEEGLKKLCKQFSFPGGVSSHVAPETPGSINEGGELGYSLSHAFGAVLDNPDLIASVVVGDGEAETGPLATSWHSNKFINPATDGAVLPILHLNGYKIANPTVLARIPKEELDALFVGYGWKPYYVEGHDIDEMNEKMASVMEKAVLEIRKIQNEARLRNKSIRPKWPMIILRTPKGWTGPKEVNGTKIEGSFHAHQVPFEIKTEDDLKQLETWLKSYEIDDLFDKKGKLIPELKELCPKGKRRMGSNPHTNGGLLLKELKTPNFKKYEVKFDRKGSVETSDMMELGNYIRDLVKMNSKNNNFRIFGPDEFLSNRLNHVFEVTNRKWQGTIEDNDEFMSNEGIVMDSMLSEHLCEGWLEGYLLTGRHGFFHSYESFIRIVDSMASQHAKWLKVTKELPWRQKISSLNYILSSHVWQQDHNGFTHQDPGFLNHLITKKPDIVRIYLPFDANTLLSCFDHVIKTKNYINVLVASKHLRPQWLSADEAEIHCKNGLGTLGFASMGDTDKPDLVLACAGDTPTLECIAAVSIIKKFINNINIKLVNVVDVTKLMSNHPHSLTDHEYDKIFTKDKPIIFTFHGYPSLIDQLTCERNNKDIDVYGYNEEGTITTPFDMRVQNEIDRYNIILKIIKKLDLQGEEVLQLKHYCMNLLKKHHEYIRETGLDIDEVLNWKF